MTRESNPTLTFKEDSGVQLRKHVGEGNVWLLECLWVGNWPRLPMVVVRRRERQECADSGILRRIKAEMKWV